MRTIMAYRFLLDTDVRTLGRAFILTQTLHNPVKVCSVATSILPL